MNGNYILDEHGAPVEEPDTLKWGQWFGDINNRRVGDTEIGNVRVSTVFLGLNHNFDAGPPLLYETMIFGGTGELEDYGERYSTREQAIAGHEKACELARLAAATK